MLGKAPVHFAWEQEKAEVPGTPGPLSVLKSGSGRFVLLLHKSQDNMGREAERVPPLVHYQNSLPVLLL